MSFFSSLTKDREYGFKNPKEQLQHAHFSPIQAKKLKLEKELKGHVLCVNRLSWNTDGSMLVSGSDDRRVLLWKYPDVDALPVALTTRHMCNIFAVHFLPCTNNKIIVSGGMDKSVQMHRLDADPGSMLKYPSRIPGTQNQSFFPEAIEVQPKTTVFSCHQSSVKAMAVETMNPNNFWSASEDGTVRQFDIRCPNMNREESLNVLISLRTSTGGVEEVKGIDINQVRPHQLALACSDQYIRIYDRRKLSLGGLSNMGPGPLLRLAPPQFSGTGLKGFGRSLNTTHVSFSNMGDKVVATYQADHAYSFDVTGEGVMSSTYLHDQTCDTSMTRQSPAEDVQPAENMMNIQQNRLHEFESNAPYHLSAVSHITAGNICLDAHKFNKAIECFSDAIYHSPCSWDLYVKRARALLERGYAGDPCFALRDCEQAIILNRKSDEARFLQIKSLLAMSEWKVADALRVQFEIDFPAAASSALFEGFGKEIYDQGQNSSADQKDQSENEELESSRFDEPALWNTVGMWGETTGGQRLLARYLGHCNMQTDIKESVFLGQNDDLVACGSDDGMVFIYDAVTGKIVRVIHGAEHVANCVQAHPSRTALATSGLGSGINIWGPSGEFPDGDEETIQLVEHNQQQIKCGSCSFSSEISDAHIQFLLNSYELVELYLDH